MKEWVTTPYVHFYIHIVCSVIYIIPIMDQEIPGFFLLWPQDIFLEHISRDGVCIVVFPVLIL